MSITEVVAGVYRIELEFVNVYVCTDGERLTLIDTGIATSAALIERAIIEKGWRIEQLEQIVLSHHHDDHRGSAAELSESGSARVLVHSNDAGIVRGDVEAPTPNVTDAERAIFDSLPAILPVAACNVDRELAEGNGIDLLGGGRVVAAPGHTPGSIAVLAEGRSVPFTGDAVVSFEGRAFMGPFNADRVQAVASFRKIAALEFDVACVGHGAPIVGGASEQIREAAQRLERAEARR